MEEHDRYKKKENSKTNGGEKIFFLSFWTAKESYIDKGSKAQTCIFLHPRAEEVENKSSGS